MLEEREFEVFVIKSEGKGASHGVREAEEKREKERVEGSLIHLPD